MIVRQEPTIPSRATPGGFDVAPMIRRVPYPYQAMLAICSDLDSTPDRNVYYEMMRYLNTPDSTSLGPGVNLEVGNTIYMAMPPHQFAYWTTDDLGREMIRTLIRSGHIDCLHSYGEHVVTRAQAARCIEELDRHRCKISVWVDHASAPNNFGPDIMRGTGDLTGAAAYHADLTCEYGVRFVWRGRVTSVIGQDVPRRLRTIWTPRQPLASFRTLGKELSKTILARTGNEKYAMHRSNALTREIRLRSGQPAIEFIRCNPYWGGVGMAATADGLADVLTDETLAALIESGGLAILYTHLGKSRNRDGTVFGARTRRAFELLARHAHTGTVMVTTTHRLLEYQNATRTVTVTSDSLDGVTHVRITPQREDANLSGLTLYVADPARTRVHVNGREIPDVIGNGPDETGRCSVSLPWRKLAFPRIPELHSTTR